MYRCINPDCGDVYWEGDERCFVCGHRGLISWPQSSPGAHRHSPKVTLVRFILGDMIVTEEVTDLFGER
jgi:hypothetical protein